MDYEKKYKEALERAKAENTDEDMLLRAALERIFPELIESEDEKIRKSLIDGFTYILSEYEKTGCKQDCVWLYSDLKVKDVLAWLEKQKESLHIKETCKENEYSFTHQKSEEEISGNNGGISPNWSEEDERILNGIIGLIDHDQHYGVSNKEMLDWLKSLRPQKQWKPTEEQMKALDFAIDCVVMDEFCYQKRELIELYNQLQELRYGKRSTSDNQECGDVVHEG